MQGCAAAHGCALKMRKCVVQGLLVSHSDIRKDEMWHWPNCSKRVVQVCAIARGVC